MKALNRGGYLIPSLSLIKMPFLQRNHRIEIFGMPLSHIIKER